MSLVATIGAVRESCVAVLRVHRTDPTDPKKVGCSFGSGFCVAENRLIVTAHHILNGGQPRDPADRFYVLSVPGNSLRAYHFPVTGFALERPDLDLAVLEIGPCDEPGVGIAALGVSFDPHPDGAPVVTMGFPAPEINGINISPELEYRGGQLFLKSHANEGIVAAQYRFGDNTMYELNVGWHHGESGGPIVSVGESPKAFSVMQHYRNVQTPHGVVAGPHRGFALATIAAELAALGVKPA